MPRYLLDTNTLIYARKRQGLCLARLDSHAAETLAWSVISLQELHLGAAKSTAPGGMLAYIDSLRQRYALMDYGATSAQRAGELQAALQRQGTPIGGNDLQIAAIALAHDLTVVTHNTREFARVPGLRVEDWYA
ncbi:PIN domain-containing protein [Xylophilus sp. GW821-FHT01B05]